MAGNTRGKLKENFEGIHNNLNWITKHVNKSLVLVANSLVEDKEFAEVKGKPEEEEKYFMQNPVYQGLVVLGEATKQLDILSKGIYDKI